MILAIDPGSTCAGWSTFDVRLLTACGLLRWKTHIELISTTKELSRAVGRAWAKNLRAPLHIVCELPQVYSQRHWKGDPNDLIVVASAAGVLVGALGFERDVEWIKPHAWKGNVPKTIHNARVLDALGDRRSIFDDACKTIPASLRHNVIDAVGLGAWAARKAP